ncbi:unnamed protein product [Cuscuta campestris]|uniref:CCHC-type domain-containing protein n=1 Tax=Cuscuta campestris TaxID=132261 RepID=A0A484LAD8_9ASTE|nr:unnamed protein product [Cuscuta campestris]
MEEVKKMHNSRKGKAKATFDSLSSRGSQGRHLVSSFSTIPDQFVGDAMTDQEFEQYFGGRTDANLQILKDIFEDIDEAEMDVEPILQSNNPTEADKEAGEPETSQGPGKAAANLRANVEKAKTIKFLLGLDDEQFGTLCGQILGSQPLADLNTSFYLITQEERHHSVVRARDDYTDAMAFSAPRTVPNTYQCTHCGKQGHTADRCYLIIGFPSSGRGRGRTSSNRGGGRSNRGGQTSAQPPPSIAGQSSNPATSARASTANVVTDVPNSLSAMSSDQIARLFSMLDSTPSSSDKLQEMKRNKVVVKKGDDESSQNTTTSSYVVRTIRYAECQRNVAANVGGFAVDGCREFMPSGDEGSGGELTCAACGCHRNFHRREEEAVEVVNDHISCAD